MQLLAVIEDEAVARRILLHLHLPARAPPRGSPWRPQSSLALEAAPGPGEDIDPPAVVNDRAMLRHGESRRQLFERLDRPALRALPASLRSDRHVPVRAIAMALIG